MTDTSLIAKLRYRIKDTRYERRAIGLSVIDDAVQTAIAEVTRNHLIVTVMGGSTNSIDLDLSSSRYNTIGKLKNELSRIRGYQAELDEDAEVDHLSTDLEPFGLTDIKERDISLKHNIFSDAELEDILTEAIHRHNPSFSIQTVPHQEQVFVIQLAHAQVCRIQAYDAGKRKGLDSEVGSLIQLAESLEKAYTDDTTRLRRALVSPKEANSNLMQQGDVVIGSQFRRSLRTGFHAPMSANIPPDAAQLLEPQVRDEEDENIRFNWLRNKDYDFYSYELWLDTRPDVQRTRDNQRPTTSRMIFRSFGANSNFDTVAFSSFVEEFGQLITSYVGEDLEPDSDYYARLYIVDLNYETVASEVIRYHTKPYRIRFDTTNPLDVYLGPPGTTVTVNFRSDRGAWTADAKLMLGGKEVAATMVDATHVTFVVPTFAYNPAGTKKDLVVISRTGLIDKVDGIFQVTS